VSSYLSHKTLSEPYIHRFAGYPRTGGAGQDVHVAPGCRPPAARSRSELSLATRSGPRKMEATCGNGYAPVRGMPWWWWYL